jgi:hypothetical protein
MNHPTVHDAKGRVLKEGSRVRYGENATVAFGDAICGFPWISGKGWAVEVAMRGPGSGSHHFPTVPADEPNTYRCPDLLLMTDDEIGDANNG